MNQRIVALQNLLSGWEVEALLIENPIDLFYLTGMKMSRGRLWIRSQLTELWVDGRYFDEARRQFPHVYLLTKGKPSFKRVGVDSQWTTLDGLQKLKREYPDTEWVPIVHPIQQLRAIKDSSEIECLRKAAQITWEGIRHIKRRFREGVSEEELAIAFEFFVRKQGASSMAFEPIVAFGENSAYPHHRSSASTLKQNQIVLVDVGAVYQNYCADVTRVFFFGEPDLQFEKMMRLVREADQAARKWAKPGSRVGDLDSAAREVFSKAGVESQFAHGLGHGVGLEVHEYPTIRQDGEDRDALIQSNMVVAIEPGLYQPGLGGVRYENSGVITDQGFVSFYPEKPMSRRTTQLKNKL